MEVDYIRFIKAEFRDVCSAIFESINETYFGRLSSLLHHKMLEPETLPLLQSEFKRSIGARIAYPEEVAEYRFTGEDLVIDREHSKIIFWHVNEEVSNLDRVSTEILSQCDETVLVLPHQVMAYRPHQRYVIDAIMREGQITKCTDVHFEPVYDFKGSFRVKVQFRKGIFTEPVELTTNIDVKMLNDIIEDMIKNRSRQVYKSAHQYTQKKVSFSLVDPLFLVRCEVLNTIGGSMLVIRFLPSFNPPRVTQLGFDERTERDLKSLAKTPSGFSLVTGVIGSGKGTTVNAVALETLEDGNYSMVSVDSPIEFLGDFPQVEYSSQEELYDVANSIKKLDRNYVFLNEIATQETARQVFNLVVSGVHVITTIHNNRVYRVMYKMNEMIGELYTNLIPYMNYISYQDKASITCKKCLQAVTREYYIDDPDTTKFLEFLELDTITQSLGCNECNNSGINNKGIQVLSEHIYFTSAIKMELLQANIHEQMSILKKHNALLGSLEEVVKLKLQSGEILVDQALSKLDTWR